MFIDRARVTVQGGDGGRGAISFRREAHVPRGGPDGGDGGRGGDVVFRVEGGMTTLSEFRFRRTLKAPDGGAGAGKDRTGRSGTDLIVRVPPGTLLKATQDDAIVADLVAPEQEIVVARGGRGGKGNARFVSSVRRVPRIAEAGQKGERRELELELKLIADVGLVGLPNAGKSTLLAALTRAHPKIADYPFTTLTPNLGVARTDDRELVVADIPGLIEGAHRGAGLGQEFLRHIERTRLLVHVVDAAGDDPVADLRVIDAELAAHGRGLAERPRIIAMNKVDLPQARSNLARLRAAAGGRATVPVSAAAGEGVDALAKRIFADCPPRVEAAPADAYERRIELRASGREWSVAREHGGFRVSGDRLERLASGIDWGSPEASAYFHQLLARSGIEHELRSLGVREGDAVRIGERELEWKDAAGP